MVKVEIEIPEAYVQFIEKWQRWTGESVDVPGYIQGGLKSLMEGDYGWMYNVNHKRAEELYALMIIGEAAEA